MDELGSSDLVEQLREAARQYPVHVASVDGHARLMFLALATAVAAVGECRLTTPYASLRPVLEPDGLRWACTHPGNEHRSDLVAGRQS